MPAAVEVAECRFFCCMGFRGERNMFSVLKAPLGCLFIVLYILIIYKRNKRTTTEASRIFCLIMIVTLVNLIMDFFTTLYEVAKGATDSTIYVFGFNLFMETTMLFAFLVYRYFLIHIEWAMRKKCKVDRVISEIGLVVASLLMVLAPVEVEYGLEVYSYGLKLRIVHTMTIAIAVASIVRYILSRSILEAHKAYTMRTTMTIMSIAIMIQMLMPDFMIVEFAYTMVIIGIYLHMENPEKFIHLKTGLFNERALRRALNEHDVLSRPTPIFVYAFRTEEQDEELLKKVMLESTKYMAKFRHMSGYYLKNDVLVFVKGSGWERRKKLKATGIPKLSKDYKEIMEFSTSFQYPDDCKSFDEVMERLEEFKLQNANVDLYIDKMTGVYSRNRYEIDIQSFLQERKELHYYVADLNNLKITNDKFGHLAGDGLIRDMAYILQDAFSEDGYVYRIGGDEFAVIYMGSETQATMLNAVEQVCKKVNRNRSIPIRYAIGYAKYDKDQNTWKEVLEQADASMYKDKLSNPERIKYEE